VTTACAERIDEIEVEFVPVPTVNLGNDTSLCPDETLLLDATFPDATYLWQDGSTQAFFNVTEAGTYSVTVSNDCTSETHSVDIAYFDDFTVDLGTDQTACEGENVSLNIAVTQGDIRWSTGSTANNITVSESGTYSVTVTTACAEKTDEIEVEFVTSTSVDLGSNTEICPGESLTLDATTANATYQWQDGSTAATLTAQTAGTYSVTVTTDCSTSEASIVVGQIETLPTIDLGENRVVCDQEPISLDATVNIDNVNYLWSDGSTASALTISESGTYSVTVSN